MLRIQLRGTVVGAAAGAALLAFTHPIRAQVVNAPVAPEAIYVGRGGGLSVIDLNGFGAGTGSPTFVTPFSANPPAPLNGKSQVRGLGTAGFVASNQTSYLLAAVRGPGGARVVMGFHRQ